MKDRCYNKKNLHFAEYGGRGITVCERWMDFVNFYEDMGDRKDGMTIDRINNDGNYEPGNCRWATRTVQQRNRRTNRLLTVDGETQCIAVFSEKYGIPFVTITSRLRRGWSDADAVKVPIKTQNRNGRPRLWRR
jgi:hypothetical protein